MREPVSHQAARIAQSLMTGVEQPQLHQLVRLHVGNDLNAGVFEPRLERLIAVGEQSARPWTEMSRPPVAY